MNTIQCPSKNQLSEYALGRLKLDDSQDIEAHLETCEECRTTLQSAWKAEDAFLQSLRKKKARTRNEPQDQLAQFDTGVQADASTQSEHPDFVRDYRILKVLGRGGMGAVYLAQNERFAGGKKVAIKLIKPDRMNDEKLMARFHRETAAMGAFEHPNLVWRSG